MMYFLLPVFMGAVHASDFSTPQRNLVANAEEPKNSQGRMLVEIEYRTDCDDLGLNVRKSGDCNNYTDRCVVGHQHYTWMQTNCKCSCEQIKKCEDTDTRDKKCYCHSKNNPNRKKRCESYEDCDPESDYTDDLCIPKCDALGAVNAGQGKCVCQQTENRRFKDICQHHDECNPGSSTADDLCIERCGNHNGGRKCFCQSTKSRHRANTCESADECNPDGITVHDLCTECVDDKDDCSDWANDGDCDSAHYKELMRRECKKSCGICGGNN